MKGAREYRGLLQTEQIGRLYIVAGHHARGDTLQIYVLPEGEVAVPNGPNNKCLNSKAVEVYGVTGGQPGWTEEYGWLHRGPWMDDFEDIIKQRRESKRTAELQKADQVAAQAASEKARKLALLADYKSGAA